MDDVEEQILAYPHLSAEEQRRIEGYVEANPEWASLLRDVRSLERLAVDAQENLPSDALLATYVVVQHLHPEEVPSSLRKAFGELEARIEEDESLRREVNATRRRLREAEAAIDPAPHFEALTGHSLETKAESEEVNVTEPEGAREERLSAVEALFNLPLIVRRMAMAVVLLGGLYVGLYGVSVASQSPTERLAAVDISDRVIENYANTKTRGISSGGDTLSVDNLYLEALSTLQAAQHSTLGLFPRYDAEGLGEARQLFRQVLDQVDPGSFLGLEARFYLGKIALAQERPAAAQRHFKAVVKQQGRKKDQAYEILKTLQQERASTGE